MIGQGFILMALGMGMVFIFLIMLICCMGLLAKLVVVLNKIMPESSPAAHAAPNLPVGASVSGKPRLPAQGKEDLSIVGAVVAAAYNFKNRKDN